jgi:tetratricopeptide (TPR) repeat protein
VSFPSHLSKILQRFAEVLTSPNATGGLIIGYRLVQIKGSAFIALKKYDETLLVSEQAIHLDPNSALAYMNKGYALTGLQRYDEALPVLEQASRLDPGYRMAYNMLLRFMNSGGDEAFSLVGF